MRKKELHELAKKEAAERIANLSNQTANTMTVQQSPQTILIPPVETHLTMMVHNPMRVLQKKRR